LQEAGPNDRERFAHFLAAIMHIEENLARPS
jgi:hypothetical protein